MHMTNLLYYEMGNQVEAFSTRKGSALPYYVIQSHQIHSDKIAFITAPNTAREDLQGIDALITNLEECPIAVRSADCVPILLYDPTCSVVAAVHSGWRGTVKKIVQKVIKSMVVQYRTTPCDLKAVIGPSIGPNSFCVHEEVVKAFNSSGFPLSKICRQYNDGLFKINLWEANRWLLIESGVKSTNIQIEGIDTFTHHDEFFSARYERDNKCGRTLNVIKIKQI